VDRKRVVVTGMGLLSPIGNTVEDAWQSAKNGRSGIDWVTDITVPDGVNPVAGQVRNFDPVEIFGKRDARRVDRITQFSLVAARQAIENAGISGISGNGNDPYDYGVIIGTGAGAVHTFTEMVLAYEERGRMGVSPALMPSLLHDNVSAKITMEYNFRGPNYSIVSACATGNNAIGDATDLIRLGRAKVMLAGATESGFVNVVMSGFHNLRVLADYCDDPSRAARPFDLNRTGFIASEGAGMLVLEEYEHALARSATIYAEVLGYGQTSDAYHITAPLENGEAAAHAITLALRDADLEPGDIDYINAHGTGTQLNDHSETLAIKKALGEQAYAIPISSTKSMTGHLLAATPSIEAIVSIMALRDNYVPPTINYETPDPKCDLDYVPNVGRAVEVNIVMSNAFGFGGHNAVLIFGAPPAV
jgi:3-oxoacyl-[acyl-carrier-protein] synthase II